MNIFEARPGCISREFRQPALPDRDFLEKALAAIKKRRGLIHGSLDDHGRVCALGAFALKNKDACINVEIAEALQKFNDSMPKASPEVRRAKVILWIEKRLTKLS